METFAKRPCPWDSRPTLNPSPGGEGWGEGSSGQPTSNTTSPLVHPIPGAPVLTLSLEGVQTGHIIYMCSETWFTHPAMRWRIGTAACGATGERPARSDP